MGLLSRARRGWRGGSAEPPEPQFYRVCCAEGHLLRGQRTEGYQALRCPACGEGVFILPRSPLPDPPAPAAVRVKRHVAPVEEGPIPLSEAPPQTTVAPADIEIEWEEDVPTPEVPQPEPPREARPVAEPPAAAAQSRATTPAPSSRPRPGAQPRRAAVASSPTRPSIPAQPRRSFRQRLWRHRHALAVTGVVLLVLGTVGQRVFRSRLEQLPQIAEASRAAGLEALASGQFDLARQQLARAASALEQLGDPDAPTVRQAADEAAVFAGFVGNVLEKILDDVATRSDGPAAFETLHKGRMILVDSVVVGTDPPDLAYRILAGTRWGRLDLTGFRLLEGKQPGDRVLFGARLRSVRLGAGGLWEFGLEPDSGVFILSEEGWRALEYLGWESRAALAAPPEEPPQ